MKNGVGVVLMGCFVWKKRKGGTMWGEKERAKPGETNYISGSLRTAIRGKVGEERGTKSKDKTKKLDGRGGKDRGGEKHSSLDLDIQPYQGGPKEKVSPRVFNFGL